MPKPICLIGGNGFLGGHIADALLATGTDLTIFARRPDPFRPTFDKVRYMQGDFTQIDDLRPAIQGAECVVHCLTTTTVHSSNADMPFDIDSNLVGTVRLLQECVAAGVKRVVFVSSGGAVYGPTDVVPTPESSLAHPICSYGVVKLAIENYLHMFHHLHGLEYSVLRLSNPYGPRQNPEATQGVISIFAGKALRGRKIEIWGDGTAVRDYIHAADFARSVAMAVQSNTANYVVNIGSGQGTSLNDIVASIEAATGQSIDVRRNPVQAADIPKSVLDVSLAKDILGWNPEINLPNGIADHVQWLRKVGYGT